MLQISARSTFGNLDYSELDTDWRKLVSHVDNFVTKMAAYFDKFWRQETEVRFRKSRLILFFWCLCKRSSWIYECSFAPSLQVLRITIRLAIMFIQQPLPAATALRLYISNDTHVLYRCFHDIVLYVLKSSWQSVTRMDYKSFGTLAWLVVPKVGKSFPVYEYKYKSAHYKNLNARHAPFTTHLNIIFY